MAFLLLFTLPLSLLWKDIKPLLMIDASKLAASIERRQQDLAALKESGWQVAGAKASRAARAAQAGDLLGHWREGDPVSDWRMQQELAAMQEEQRLAEEEQARRKELAALGLDQPDHGEQQHAPDGCPQIHALFVAYVIAT